MNNADFIDLENDNYIIEAMPSPLKDILRAVLKHKTDKSSFEFSQVFDTLSQDEKQYASKLLLEFHEPIDRNYYEQLVMQFRKQQWKRMIRTISTKLHKAQKEGDTSTVQKLLHDYTTLKQKMILPIGQQNRKKKYGTKKIKETKNNTLNK